MSARWLMAAPGAYTPQDRISSEAQTTLCRFRFLYVDFSDLSNLDQIRNPFRIRPNNLPRPSQHAGSEWTNQTKERRIGPWYCSPRREHRKSQFHKARTQSRASELGLERSAVILSHLEGFEEERLRFLAAAGITVDAQEHDIRP